MSGVHTVRSANANYGSGNQKDVDRARGKKRKFAIVDDLSELVDLYVSIVKMNGDEATVRCHSGEEIIDAARKGKLSEVDAVIMDYRMKDIDGFEAAKEILRFNPNLLVIIASADESIKRQATTVGFKYLRKPFTRRQLLDCLI